MNQGVVNNSASSSNYTMLNSYNNFVVSSTGVFPAITDFAGEMNFQIILEENDLVKKKWLVSGLHTSLKKLYSQGDTAPSICCSINYNFCAISFQKNWRKSSSTSTKRSEYSFAGKKWSWGTRVRSLFALYPSTPRTTGSAFRSNVAPCINATRIKQILVRVSLTAYWSADVLIRFLVF